MSDFLTKEERSIRMSQIHSSDTKPERTLRRALWHQGFRYRVNVKKLPGSPDIVLPKYRTVIFVHGCFWHGHNDCKNYSVPKTNTSFWQEKVTRNRERDQETWRTLEAMGWYVIIVWECTLEKPKIRETVDTLRANILRNGELFFQAKENRRKNREVYRQERAWMKDRHAILKAEISDIFSHPSS